MKKLVIHQPDFAPWLGFFHKLSLSNEFLIFDHVQISNGKSWSSRNKILLNGKPFWLTIPTIKSKNQRINEVKINYEQNFQKKHIGTITPAYRKARFYSEILPIIESIYLKKYEYLIDFNMDFITIISKKLNIDFTFHKSSDLLLKNNIVDDLFGNELVLELCLLCKADNYYSGSGCLDFIKPNLFHEKGINFFFQDFNHPTYRQGNSLDFISHLSIIDALMNIGFDGVSNLLKKQKTSDQLEKCISLNQIKPEISFEHFLMDDIRVATVLSAEIMTNSNKLLKITLEIGNEQKTVVSGIAEYFSPKEIIGIQVTYLYNLSPRTINGVKSSGMILMAQDNDGELVLITPDKAVSSGSIIS